MATCTNYLTSKTDIQIIIISYHGQAKIATEIHK